MSSVGRPAGIGRWLIALALFVSFSAMATSELHAHIGDGAPATMTRVSESEQTERWWGVMGAALCGLEVRLVRVAPGIGMNPYVMAAGIGGCILAMMDAWTT